MSRSVNKRRREEVCISPKWTANMIDGIRIMNSFSSSSSHLPNSFRAGNELPPVCLAVCSAGWMCAAERIFVFGNWDSDSDVKFVLGKIRAFQIVLWKSSARVKVFIGSKVHCLFCFEICTTEGRVGEKGGSANFKTKHTEPLT